MSNSALCPIARRTPALHVWLRLALAAFVLAFYAVIAMAGGIARAVDGPAASGGEPGTKGATSQQSEPQKSGTDPSPHQASGVDKPTKPDTTKADTPKTDDSDEPSTAADTSNTTPKTKTPKPSATAEAPAPTATDPVTPPVDETQEPTPVVVPEHGTAPTDTPKADTAPKSAQPVDVSHDSKRPSQTASAAAPASAEPRPTATVESNVRSLKPQADPEPASALAAAIAPPDPGPAAVPSITFNPPQLVNQLKGLVADAGTIMVSVVHTAATAVAQAFGPNSFLGVPYMLATSVANVAAAVGRSIIGAPMFEPTTGQFTVDYGILDGLAFFNPTKPPAGANDDSIFVSTAHPLPVILLNGTSATQGTNWSVGAPVLANAGYKVYTFNYGNTTGNPNSPIQAFGDIDASSAELAAEVQRVLDETGAPKVILVGHSQGGGILAVNYINNFGGADKVSQLIGIAPSNHGTDIDGLGVLQSVPVLGQLFVGIANALGPALYQQALGSPFQQHVYGNGDTRPGVLYTTIASVNDEVVTPYTQQALNGPNVTNIVLQDLYPGLVLGHANIFLSPQVWSTVLDALASNPAANPLAAQNTVAA